MVCVFCVVWVQSSKFFYSGVNFLKSLKIFISRYTTQQNFQKLLRLFFCHTFSTLPQYFSKFKFVAELEDSTTVVISDGLDAATVVLSESLYQRVYG